MNTLEEISTEIKKKTIKNIEYIDQWEGVKINFIDGTSISVCEIDKRNSCREIIESGYSVELYDEHSKCIMSFEEMELY